MSAEHSLPLFRRLLSRPLHEIDERAAVVAVQPERLLLARHRHLLHVLRQLHLGPPVDLDQLVHAAQRRLPLARHCNGRRYRQVPILDSGYPRAYPDAFRCRSSRWSDLDR